MVLISSYINLCDFSVEQFSAGRSGSCRIEMLNVYIWFENVKETCSEGLYGSGPRTVVPLGRFTYLPFSIIKIKIRNVVLSGCQFRTRAYLVLYVIRRANTEGKSGGISILN